MKPALTAAAKAAKRQQLAEAMRASFRIEGIQVSAEQARAALRAVKLQPGESARIKTDKFRHDDHSFEWSRAEFSAWAAGVAERHGY